MAFVDLDARNEKLRPFADAEAALVRAVTSQSAWLSEAEETTLRWALNLARVTVVRAPDGSDVDMEAFLDPFRADVTSWMRPALLSASGVDRPATARAAEVLGEMTRSWRRRVGETFGTKIPLEAVDREVREKALVVASGGGGGTGYVYLGAFQLLEQFNLVPRLMAGSSMGAILSLFRARRIRFHAEEINEVVQNLSYKTLFRFLQMESRYGLPATMRLYLRQGVGQFMKGPEGHPLTLAQLAIPLIVTVTGIRNGALPREPGYYERLLDVEHVPSPNALRRMMANAIGAMSELLGQRERFARIYIGADDETRSFDALDAVGFSCAVPGVIHYDVVRDDEHAHEMLRRLMEKHDVFRLVDGGVVDNVPARAAWRYAQGGALGTRNTFVLALDAFAPNLKLPLWLPLQRIVAQNVARNRSYMDLAVSFRRVLSPLELVPGLKLVLRAVQRGKEEMLPEMPFLARMVRPLPPLPEK